MELKIEVLRRRSPEETPFWQRFLYEPAGEGESVATALTRLNEMSDLRDADGSPAEPIRWQHSCLQKKCGACAMVINGRPGLACDARLQELGTVVRLEPLKKFPVVADLIVDRSVMFDNLRNMALWLERAPEEGDPTLPYEASRCLQCGCCLEVCPNFDPAGMFFGASAAVPASRVILELDGDTGLSREYRKHVYNGCGKSFSCKNICPAGIDTEQLMVNANGAAVWKLFRRKKRSDLK